MNKKKKPTNESTKKRKTSNNPRPRRRRYSDEERRAAVRDVAELGLSPAARKHGVPASTLHAWVKSPHWLEAEVKTARVANDSSAYARRFTAEERRSALELVVNGMSRTDAARAVGTTPESIRRWANDAQEAGTMPTPAAPPSQNAGQPKSKSQPTTKSVYAPSDPGQGLSDVETAAILDFAAR